MSISRRSFFAGSAAAGLTAAGAQTAAAKPRHISSAVAAGAQLPALSEDGMVAMPPGFKAHRIGTIGVEPLLSDRGGRVVGVTPSNLDGMGAFDRAGVTRLVRNHECRANAKVPVPLVPGTVHDAGCPTGMGGNTVVEVSRSGELVQQWVGLSGTIRNCAGGTTPWGSWLACEETTERAGQTVTSSVDGQAYTLQKDHGYVFEVFPEPVAQQIPLPIKAWGRAVWEGAEIGADLSSAYLTEDTKGGLFYRWTAPQGVTLRPGIATQLGEDDGVLQAAQLVRDGVALEHYGQLTEADLDVAHPVRWVDGGADRQAQTTDLRQQFPGATTHRKIEGVWSDDAGEGLWFTLSTVKDGEHPEAVANQGMIMYYSFAEQTMTLKEYWAVGSCFDAPDNITVSPWGGVVIAEDGSDPNHLVAFTERAGSSALAKDLAERGEWAGPCFGGGRALFANIQSDCTYMITGPMAKQLHR